MSSPMKKKLSPLGSGKRHKPELTLDAHGVRWNAGKNFESDEEFIPSKALLLAKETTPIKEKKRMKFVESGEDFKSTLPIVEIKIDVQETETLVPHADAFNNAKTCFVCHRAFYTTSALRMHLRKMHNSAKQCCSLETGGCSTKVSHDVSYTL